MRPAVPCQPAAHEDPKCDDLEFPCRCKADQVRDSAERLNAALALAGIEFLGFAADVIPEKALNTSYRLLHIRDHA